MDWIKEEIYKTVNIIVNKMFSQLKYNYTLDGIIREVLTSSIYKVEIDEQEYDIKSMNDVVYQVGDIVKVIVFNNNFSDKHILCKR